MAQCRRSVYGSHHHIRRHGAPCAIYVHCNAYSGDALVSRQCRNV